MLAWKLLIVAASATSALALALSARVVGEGLDLEAMLSSALSALT